MSAGANGAARPLTILIAALGGEGGGVLAEWIVEAATRAGLPVQATSVPGVAQRTGATSYYIELMPRPDPAGRAPVFALVPTAGRVDVAIASELLEAGRLLERGFVSPERTLFIASTSRVYTTAEKMQMGDGRFDGDRIHSAAKTLARRYVTLDLDALAQREGTVVSATMFGALSGAGAFPWSREACEDVIRAGGRGASASLKGFAAAYDEVAAPVARVPAPAPAGDPPPVGGADMAHLPPSLREVVSHGVSRMHDYQDEAYGELFLERVRSLVAAARSGNDPLDDPRVVHALEEAARRLALWMAYEDVPRVADLKTRAARFERIRRDANMQPDQILTVVEYMKPGAQEIAAMLPARFGRMFMARAAAGRFIPFVGKGLNLSTTGVVGYWTLRGLARMGRLRRSSLRYGEEQDAIGAWLAAMCDALARAPGFAGALAELPRLLKGYGDTHLRGRANYAAIYERVVGPALASPDPEAFAPALRKAIGAALADPEGKGLAAALAESPDALANAAG